MMPVVHWEFASDSSALWLPGLALHELEKGLMMFEEEEAFVELAGMDVVQVVLVEEQQHAPEILLMLT